ncbi:MAG: SDR family NAD(P)-dependent oxidoreductase [Anaerolineae bacterium]
MADLRERVVLITGVTGGIGPVVARTFAEAGARLALTAPRQEALDALAASLGLAEDRCWTHAADLARTEDVQTLMDALAARWGGADILLNLAGGWQGGMRVAEMTDEHWDAVLDRNLRSAFHINRAVLPFMLSRGWGRIINFGSRAVEQPGPRQAAYNVAKAGVVALTASIAAEYRRQGVSANVLLPAVIDTPGNRAQSPDADTSRWVQPSELAALMLFLCSEEGSGLNGASIPVYGKL